MWTLVKDKQPEKDGTYWVFGKIYFCPDHVDEPNFYYGVDSAYYNGKGHWYGNKIHNPIGWMEMPELPKRYQTINRKFEERYGDD